MQNYLLGIDSGATKTHLAVASCARGLRSFDCYSTLNHEELPGSYPAFEQEIKRFVLARLDSLGIRLSEIQYAVMGLAGMDTAPKQAAIESILRRLGFENLFLCNDAYLGIYAGTEHGVGVCAVCGTGANVAAVSPTGEMLQYGGIGPSCGGLGGGGYLGERVLEAVANEVRHQGKATLLTDLFFAESNLSPSALADKGFFVPRAKIPALNQLVFCAADRGDAVADGILEDCANNYAHSICAAIQSFSFGDACPVVLSGSVFTKETSPALIDKIRLQVLRREPRAQFSVLQAPPVAGALIQAMRLAGCGKHAFSRVNRWFLNKVGHKKNI